MRRSKDSHRRCRAPLAAPMFLVEHAHVDHDLAGLIVGAALELDPHPAVAFVSPLKLRATTVSAKAKKAVVSPRSGPAARYSAQIRGRASPGAGRARRNARPVRRWRRSPACRKRRCSSRRCPRRRRPEKPAHHFLARADLGKGAVPARIEIDLERLRMGIDWFLFHGLRIENVLNPQRSKREGHFGDIGFGSSAVDVRG